MFAGEARLSDGSNDVKWSPLPGAWQLRDGVYHVYGAGRVYVQDVVYDDIMLEVDCRITKSPATKISRPSLRYYGVVRPDGDWMGITVGAKGPGGILPYDICLRANGEVALCSHGEILTVKSVNAQSRLDAQRYVHLAVSVKGAHFTISLNGEKLLDYDAPYYRWGQVGLAAGNVEGDFSNVKLHGRPVRNVLAGEVLMSSTYQFSSQPLPGATVELYSAKGSGEGSVIRKTVSDERGRFRFDDLAPGEKAYWLHASKEGFAGSTARSVSVSDTGPTIQDLCLVGAPRHDIWIDSSMMKNTNGFRQVDDRQCFGAGRIEVKEQRPATERPKWWAEFEFAVAEEGDYVLYIAGYAPKPRYIFRTIMGNFLRTSWSDYWWSIDDAKPSRSSETLTITGERYGENSMMAWAYSAPQHLTAGKHTLKISLRDPAPGQSGDNPLYWWSFDAAVLVEMPALVSPVGDQRVVTTRPELRWRAPRGAARFTVQYSQEPDFSNATVTVGGVTADHLVPAQPLADGVYYWRVKPLPEQETLFDTPFTRPASFAVATGAPAISRVRVSSRTPREAVIEWETSKPCASSLGYGLSALGPSRLVESEARQGLHHRVRLTGLEPMTYYYYTVQATGPDGRDVSSFRRGFCTPRGVIDNENSPFGVFGQAMNYSDKLGAAGAKWYSDFWDWGSLEPSRGSFSWGPVETRIKHASDSGVNLMVTFWGTPPWVRPSHPDSKTYGPDDLQDARNFFRTVAEHCKGRVDWWVPGGEPNLGRDAKFGFPLGYWSSRPHISSYVAYQRATYEGLKSGDPDCHIAGINPANVDLDFIRACYDEGAADTFDVMDVHYYAITQTFEEWEPERIFASLRALMAEYGDSEKPILCSEGGGASSNLDGTTEDTQADNLVRIYVISIANNIHNLCWTYEHDVLPYSGKELHMSMWDGIFRFDPNIHAWEPPVVTPAGEPKPSFFAFRTMTENLSQTEYVGPVNLGPGLRAYRFLGKDRRVTVAWAEKGEADALLPVETEQVAIVNRKGETEHAGVTGGRLELCLTTSPVFVREIWRVE